MAELLGRKPIFPGKDYVHQLNLITKVGAEMEGRHCWQDTIWQVQYVACDYLKQCLWEKPAHTARGCCATMQHVCACTSWCADACALRACAQAVELRDALHLWLLKLLACASRFALSLRRWIVLLLHSHCCRSLVRPLRRTWAL